MAMLSQTVDESNRLSTLPTFWICYRCNLTFHEESSLSLHKEVTNHSARKIEFSGERMKKAVIL
ncbi:MAG: hypothetical protein KGH99_06005 [Thaumarchaeota archaeon]|nr:hypothetical protein [Nitrososphaerota archaeon]